MADREYISRQDFRTQLWSFEVRKYLITQHNKPVLTWFSLKLSYTSPDSPSTDSEWQNISNITTGHIADFVDYGWAARKGVDEWGIRAHVPKFLEND